MKYSTYHTGIVNNASLLGNKACIDAAQGKWTISKGSYLSCNLKWASVNAFSKLGPHFQFQEQPALYLANKPVQDYVIW